MKYLPSNIFLAGSSKSIFTLLLGVGGSQVITIVAVPILTRLYGPESFGILATYVSILSILNSISSLRYEFAINIPQEEPEAVDLVRLCLLLALLSTLTILIYSLLSQNSFFSQGPGSSEKKFLPLLSSGVLMLGLYLPLSYWAIRKKAFTLLARARVFQSLIGLFANIALSSLGYLGLIVGYVLGQSMGGLLIAFHFPRLIIPFDRKEKILSLIKILIKYRRFALFSAPSGLVGTIGNQIPVLLLSAAFSPSYIGLFVLAQRVLIIPGSLIGESIGQLFLSQASEQWRLGKLGILVKRYGFFLAVSGIIISILAIVVVAPLTAQIFSKSWLKVGYIIPLLSPLFLGQLTVSPLAMALIVIGDNRVELLSQSLLTAFKILPLSLAIFAKQGFYDCILCYSLSSLAGYMALFLILLRSIYRGRHLTFGNP